jgi:hypothetical protein
VLASRLHGGSLSLICSSLFPTSSPTHIRRIRTTHASQVLAVRRWRWRWLKIVKGYAIDTLPMASSRVVTPARRSGSKNKDNEPSRRLADAGNLPVQKVKRRRDCPILGAPKKRSRMETSLPVARPGLLLVHDQDDSQVDVHAVLAGRSAAWERTPSSSFSFLRASPAARARAGEIVGNNKRDTLVALFVQSCQTKAAELRAVGSGNVQDLAFGGTVLERAAAEATSKCVPPAGRGQATSSWTPLSVWNVVRLEIPSIRALRGLAAALTPRAPRRHLNLILGLQFCGGHSDACLLLRDPDETWKEFSKLFSKFSPQSGGCVAAMAQLTRLYAASRAQDDPLYIVEALLLVDDFVSFVKRKYESNPFGATLALGLQDRHYLKLTREIGLFTPPEEIVCDSCVAIIKEDAAGPTRSPTGSKLVCELRAELHKRGFRFVFIRNLGLEVVRRAAEEKGVPQFTTRAVAAVTGPVPRKAKRNANATPVVPEVKKWATEVWAKRSVFGSGVYPQLEKLLKDALEEASPREPRLAPVAPEPEADRDVGRSTAQQMAVAPTEREPGCESEHGEEVHGRPSVRKPDFLLITPRDFDKRPDLEALLRPHGLALKVCSTDREAKDCFRRVGLQGGRICWPWTWDESDHVGTVPVGRLLADARDNWRAEEVHLVTPFHSELAKNLGLAQYVVKADKNSFRQHCEQAAAAGKQFLTSPMFPWGPEREEMISSPDASYVAYAWEALIQDKKSSTRRMALRRALTSRPPSDLSGPGSTLLVFDSHLDDHPLSRATTATFLFRTDVRKTDMNLEEYLFACGKVGNALKTSGRPLRVWLIGEVAQLIPIPVASAGVQVWKGRGLSKCALLGTDDRLWKEATRLLSLDTPGDGAPSARRSGDTGARRTEREGAKQEKGLADGGAAPVVTKSEPPRAASLRAAEDGKTDRSGDAAHTPSAPADNSSWCPLSRDKSRWCPRWNPPAGQPVGGLGGLASWLQAFDSAGATIKWNLTHQDGTVCSLDSVIGRCPLSLQASPAFCAGIRRLCVAYEYSLRAQRAGLPTFLGVDLQGESEAEAFLRYLKATEAKALLSAAGRNLPRTENPFAVAPSSSVLVADARKRPRTVAEFIQEYESGSLYVEAQSPEDSDRRVPRLRCPHSGGRRFSADTQAENPLPSFSPGAAITGAGLNQVLKWYGARLRDYAGSAPLYAFLCMRMQRKPLDLGEV